MVVELGFRQGERGWVHLLDLPSTILEMVASPQIPWFGLFSNLSFSADVHWFLHLTVLIPAVRFTIKYCELQTFILSVYIGLSNSHKPSSNIFIFIHNVIAHNFQVANIYLLYIWVSTIYWALF